MAEVISAVEIQAWDDFPIELVTSVCQLSTFCRCSNVVTALSRQAPLYAFGTAAGEIAIMQVAPCKSAREGNSLRNSQQHQQQNESPSSPSSSSSSPTSPTLTTTTSNQRSRARDRRDALRASAKVDRVGFFSLPQPSLPEGSGSGSGGGGGGESAAQFQRSKWNIHNSNNASNPSSVTTFFHSQQTDTKATTTTAGTTSTKDGMTSPVTSSPNMHHQDQQSQIHETMVTTSAALSELPPKSSNQAYAASQSSGGNWAVTQLSYSPFSNTIFCLCGGIIYILELIADDSSAVSTLTGNTEQRFLRCVIVGQAPTPAQARGESFFKSNLENEGVHATNASDHQQQSKNSNNAWLHFTIHSSLTEIRLAAFALNQVSCFVVDTKPLRIAAAQNNNNNNNNADQFLPSSARLTPPSSHRSHFHSPPASSTSVSNNTSQAKVEINSVNSFSVRHLFSSPASASPAIASSFFHNNICASWCGPLFVCNNAQNYNFYAPEFSKPVRVVSATKATKTSGLIGTSIFRERSNTISMRCVGLYDSFHMDNTEDFSEEAPGVALLITEVVDGGKAAADVALPFFVQIWMYQRGHSGSAPDVVLHREIPCLFSMSSAVHLAATGPWLLVVSADGGGVDVHNWQTGSHVQSCAEEFASDFSIAQNLSSLFSRSSAVVQQYGKQIMWKHQATKHSIQDLLSRLYVEGSADIIIGGAGKLLMLQFDSPRAALTQYARAPSIEGIEEEQKAEEMMALQMFAVSVGNRGGLFADDTTIGKTVQAVIPDGYDDLLQSFSHVRNFSDNQQLHQQQQQHRNGRNNGSSSNNSNSDLKGCFNCKSSFGFLAKRHFVCSCCLRHFCERCAPIREAGDLIRRGVMRHGIRICDSCLVRLDENMFTLLLHGKYREALHHLVSSRMMEAQRRHPEQYADLANMSFTGQTMRLDDLAEFHLPHIGASHVDEILWRCIHQGKLALCAQLLPMACGTDEFRWQHFVMYFLTDADAAMSLANNIPHHQLQTQIGKFVYSSILIALVKYSPMLLTQTLGKWPANFYSAQLVTSAIESTLKSRVEQAMATQRECQVGGVPVMWESPWNWKSLGELYIDDDVRTLVSAYLMLCKKKRLYVDALQMHLNYFEKFLPHPSATASEGHRERGGTVFEKTVVVHLTSGHHQQQHDGVGLGNASTSTPPSSPSPGGSTTSPNNKNGGNFFTTTFSNNASRPDTGRGGQQGQQAGTKGATSFRLPHNEATPRSSRSHYSSSSSSSIQNQHIGTTATKLLQFHSTTRQRCINGSVASKFSPLINTFEWILNYNLTDVLLRPGERLGGGEFFAHYDGPSLLPLIIQIWRMDAVKYLLQWPELTSRPDTIASLVQQISDVFNIGKDGLVKTASSSGNNANNNNNNSNTNLLPSSVHGNANLMAIVGTGGREYARTNNNSNNINNSFQPQSPATATTTINFSRRDVAAAPVVGQESDGPMILQSFLHEITAKDVGATVKHHNLLASLYVHHAPHRLLDFLREPTVTSLDYAKLSQLVRQKRMFGELAYIMGRSGDASEAIRLVVRCLRDVEFAIQFVEDTDEQLWDELIKHVLQSPTLIGDFLDHAIGHYDMAKFLEQIPSSNRLRVPNASRRLGRVIVEQAIDTSLNQTSLDSYKTENFGLFKELYTKSRGAVRFTSSTLSSCSACAIGIDLYTRNASNSSVVFNSVGGGRSESNDDHQHQYHHQQRRQSGPSPSATSSSTTTSVTQRLFHPSCAEPQCGGTIPAHSFESSRLMMKEKQRKRALTLEKDPAHLAASLEVYRDSEVDDLCEILPKALRFTVLSFLDYDSRDACRRVSRSWYLHLRALECGIHILLYNNHNNHNANRFSARGHLHNDDDDDHHEEDDDEGETVPHDGDDDDLAYDKSSDRKAKKNGGNKNTSSTSSSTTTAAHHRRRRYQYKKKYDLVYGRGLEHRTVFQRYQWIHGTFPARRPPFGSYDEGGNGDDDDNVFSTTCGLKIGGHGSMCDRLNPVKRSEDLLVPVGNDCFHSRN